MPFVSLNLDLDDVSLVRHALSDALATCVCSGSTTGIRCASCRARMGLIQELERMSQRTAGPRRPRFIPMPASIAFGDCREVAFDPVPTVAVDVRLVRGGLSDD